MTTSPAPDFARVARLLKREAKRLLSIGFAINHHELRFLRSVAKGKCPAGTKFEFHEVGGDAWQVQVMGRCGIWLEGDL